MYDFNEKKYTEVLKKAFDEHGERCAKIAVDASAQLLEKGYERDVGKPWCTDGKSSKHDKCPHDIWIYEDCEQCAAAAIRKIDVKKLIN